MAIEEDKNKSDDGVKSVNDDYNKRMTRNNHPDPSAKRNIGRNGELERDDQKDRLENLHIHGNETTGYGDNNSRSIEEFAQGPGFEFEGSDTAMSGSTSGIRTTDQPLDTTNDETGSQKRDKERGSE